MDCAFMDCALEFVNIPLWPKLLVFEKVARQRKSKTLFNSTTI